MGTVATPECLGRAFEQQALSLLFDEVESVKSGANDITLSCPQIFLHRPFFYKTPNIPRKLCRPQGRIERDDVKHPATSHER